MTMDEIRALLAKVTFAPSCVDMGWKWEVRPAAEGWHLRTTFRRPDRDSGVIGIGDGRWWHVPEDASPSGLVKTAFSAAKMILEHELMESFRFEGVRIFDPHHDLDDLRAAATHRAQASETPDQREERRTQASFAATDNDYRGAQPPCEQKPVCTCGASAASGWRAIHEPSCPCVGKDTLPSREEIVATFKDHPVVRDRYVTECGCDWQTHTWCPEHSSKPGSPPPREPRSNEAQASAAILAANLTNVLQARWLSGKGIRCYHYWGARDRQCVLDDDHPTNENGTAGHVYAKPSETGIAYAELVGSETDKGHQAVVARAKAALAEPRSNEASSSVSDDEIEPQAGGPGMTPEEIAKLHAERESVIDVVRERQAKEEAEQLRAILTAPRTRREVFPRPSRQDDIERIAEALGLSTGGDIGYILGAIDELRTQRAR